MPLYAALSGKAALAALAAAYVRTVPSVLLVQLQADLRG